MPNHPFGIGATGQVTFSFGIGTDPLKPTGSLFARLVGVDGALSKVSGTGVRGTRYEYGVEAEVALPPLVPVNSQTDDVKPPVR